MTGTVIIIVLLLVIVPVAIIMSGLLASGVLGQLLQKNVDEDPYQYHNETSHLY